MVSSRAQKMFKKFVEPREDRRSSNFTELSRYLDDRWMAKGYTDRVGKFIINIIFQTKNCTSLIQVLYFTVCNQFILIFVFLQRVEILMSYVPRCTAFIVILMRKIFCSNIFVTMGLKLQLIVK